MATSTVYDSKNLKFCANAKLFISPTGTALPATLGAEYPTPWVELGYIDEKGVQVDDARTLVDIKADQSIYTIAQLASEKKHTLTFNLQEWTPANFVFAFGGGSWATVTGINTYTPPDPSFMDNRQISFEWSVAGIHWRWVVYKGIVTSNIQSSLVKTAEALLPITFTALGTQSGQPWGVSNDDPEFTVSTGS